MSCHLCTMRAFVINWRCHFPHLTICGKMHACTCEQLICVYLMITVFNILAGSEVYLNMILKNL